MKSTLLPSRQAGPHHRGPAWDDSVLFQRRRGRRRRAGLAQGGVVRLLPVPVAESLLQRVVDEVAERLVLLLQPDTVLLGAERLTDDQELVGVAGGVAEQDRAVGGDH